MKEYYPSRIDCPVPPGNMQTLRCSEPPRRPGLLVHALLFLLILVFQGYENRAAAQDNIQLPQITGYGMDEYGVFVEFYIPTYLDVVPVLDLATLVNGELKVTDLQSGETIPILKYTGNQDKTASVYPEDGTYHSGFRARGYDKTDNTWTSYLFVGSPFPGIVVHDPNSPQNSNDPNTQIVVRWYIPGELIGKDLAFTDDAQSFGIHDGLTQAPTLEVLPLGPEMTYDNPVPDAQFTFDIASHADSIAVKYGYQSAIGGTYDDHTGTEAYTFGHYIDDASIVTDPDNDSPQGAVNIGRSDYSTPVTFVSELVCKEGFNTYKREQALDVPPIYPWPQNLETVYDSVAGTIKLSWQTAPIPAGAQDQLIKGDDFEIQRSTDSTFQNADATADILVPFNSQLDTYSAEDDLSEENIQGTVYYRIRRTKSSADWEWNVLRETSREIHMHLPGLGLKDSVRLEYTPSPQVSLSWKVIPGVWPDGTQFVIRRYNQTDQGQGYTDFSLTREDMEKETYLDKNVNFCTYYHYALFVKPGNTRYATPQEFPLPGDAIALDMGTLSSLTASKGYFNDHVSLQWHSVGGFSNYSVLRSATGSLADAAQIATLEANTTAAVNILYDDNKGTPGIYYTYFVQGVSDCGGVERKSAPLSSIGFRSPTGTVYGRITYTNTQSVENAEVRLQHTDGTRMGQSIHLDGSPKSYLETDSLHTSFSDQTLTVEAWIRPDEDAPKNELLFDRPGQYELGIDGQGAIYFKHLGQLVVGGLPKGTGSFIHVTAVHNGEIMKILVGDSVIASMTSPYQPASDPGNHAYIGGAPEAGNFRGYIDEMRVWNIALSDSQVIRDQTRLITGGEKGLVAYWRFDETVPGSFFDIAHQGDAYSMNDGTMDSGSVKHSGVIPTPEQLGLKSFTDSTGNYMITGIPYSGINGSLYAIAPVLGTHQFDPATVTRLFSAGSSTFTIDFTDKSAYNVSGTIYYYNSRIPVKGVQFKVDGRLSQKSNGEVIQTDETGRFELSVPVGVHEVQAYKDFHVFAGGGKITDGAGNNLNYQQPVSERILYDSTTVRFIGRVSGGSVQESFPLGHSLSTNNLGKELSLTLQMQNQAFILCNSNVDSTLAVDHLLPADISDSSLIHQTKVVYDPAKNQIHIYPDPRTGEFAADLIPEKFLVEKVTATGWGDILENGEIPVLDLTNRFLVKSIPYHYVDSIVQDPGPTKYLSYTDTVRFNDSAQYNLRVDPVVTMAQLDPNGKELSFFGDSTYEVQTIGGNDDTISLIKHAKTGTAQYLFGYPVFKQAQSYHFRIKAFETYPFYENDNKDIRVVDQKEVIDLVPTTDGHITILNSLRTGSTGADTLTLDSLGTTLYAFYGGAPDFAAHGIKDFSMSVRFGQAFNLNWTWNGLPALHAFVMGKKQTGTDFITAGPDELLYVLRDPPGNRSFSFVEKGSTITHTSTYSGSLEVGVDENLSNKIGEEIITWEGVGGGFIHNVEQAHEDLGLDFEQDASYTGTRTKVTTTTFTSGFKTSDDPTLVGAPADVFVGYSSNLTFGETHNMTMIKSAELKSTDVVLYTPDPANGYLLVQRDGINIGQQFNTMFSYPQQHIIKVLIPNMERIKKTMLYPSGTAPDAAQAEADKAGRDVYVSNLAATDPNFGKSNSDVAAFGAAAKGPGILLGEGMSYKVYYSTKDTVHVDSIEILNENIAAWEDRLSDNEKVKVQALNKNLPLIHNYSFHAGSPVAYSEQYAVLQDSTNTFNVTLLNSATEHTSFEVMDLGFDLTIKEHVNTTQGGTLGESLDTTQTFGFNMAADGTDEYLSVDTYRAKDRSFVFVTKGGVTGCPYEGPEKTSYYQKGTLIDQPTMQIEVPSIAVDKPVASNVPSSRPASYTLYLRNESEAKLPGIFTLSYADIDSVKGSFIAVDGSSIAGGRTFIVQYGQTVTKVLTLSKGPDAMDYNNIPIILHSSCQYDPSGYQALIADTVLVSAHFVPSCSDIHIADPMDQWILNAGSPTNAAGNHYLPITLDQFDLSNTLFDHIALQYKPSASGQWLTLTNFYGDSAKYQAAAGAKQHITDAGKIDYDFEMDETSFGDQAYDIRALSVCNLGGTSTVSTPSNTVSGLKDTYEPRIFGSPQPANGILGVGEDVRVNFNEPVAAGLLTHSDITVTGIRNGSPSDHSVSARFDGKNDEITTAFNKNLTGRDVTVALWVSSAKTGNQTLFSQGNVNESLEMAYTADGHLTASVGKDVITSDLLDFKPGEWAYVALVYDHTDSTVSAFYNYKEVIHQVPVKGYSGVGPFVFGRSIRQGGQYFLGNMHDIQVWTRQLQSIDLQLDSRKRLSGAENGLLAYYPVTEGKDSTLFDKAHGNNAVFNGTWSTPPGKAIALDGNGYLAMSTSTIPVTRDMDYTISFWFKGAPGQGDATLLSNGKGDGTDPGGSGNLIRLGFDKGLLTYHNNGFTVQADGNYLDDQWHQVSVAVNRVTGTGQLLVDGALQQYFDAGNLGGIASAVTYLGARVWYDPNDAITPHFDRFFTGEIDDYRLWDTYLNPSFLRDINTRLEGNELGLLAYYPFEEYYASQNNQNMRYTLGDKTLRDSGSAAVADAMPFQVTETDETAPIKDRGPVANLKFDYVVNNDALIINLLEEPQAIDKCRVTFRVNRLFDQHGNKAASPVTWSAYIDQNPLKWSDDALNLSKKHYDPMQFESYLVNSSGNSVPFRLDNLPGWLEAAPMDGTVLPEGKQKITFTVNGGLNVGSYDDIIEAVNDNQETQGLTLNLKVKGEVPDWKVNPADFKYNMTIYGKIRVNHLFSDNPDDLLAAFVDGRCVGVTNNTYFRDNDLWYAFLTVYSDTTQEDHLEFRIWNAGDGKIYQANPSVSTLAFTNNAIIGTPANPVIFDGQEMFFQNIPLTAGWNWLSFNLADPGLDHIKTALSNGRWHSGDEVKNDHNFDQYSSVSGWVGTLPGLNNTSLFMLHADSAQTLSMSGSKVDVKKTGILLKGRHWNYISYLPQENMTLKEALAGYHASSEDVIKSQTGFAMYDARGGWVGNLTYLEPGKGYMLYRSAATDTTFHYPDLPGILRLQTASHDPGSARLNPFQNPVAGNFKYADNMTLLATPGEGFSLQPGDRVQAYAGNELRGEALAVKNPVTGHPSFFLNIAGRNPQPVTFKIERNGHVIRTSSTVLPYGRNTSWGKVDHPFVVDFDGSATQVTITPNPFSKEVNIHVTINDQASFHEIRVSVFDVGGRLVYRETPRKISGGTYQIIWDGRTGNGARLPAGMYFLDVSIDNASHHYKMVKYK